MPLMRHLATPQQIDDAVDHLVEAFFPALQSLISQTSECENQITFPPITEQQMAAEIRRAPPNKAPGADGIPNMVWRLLAGESATTLAVSGLDHSDAKKGLAARLLLAEGVQASRIARHAQEDP
ncbi:hypothetical protein N7522_000509 [Penicillium canescens]|uniref:uncharacterized protein n=1 Tax=Penicillium canescens TaxID=5083 RepID=UPI0026DED47A|nr:uncharacterized protein N7446_011971 [Penicillium canescens]KAJ6019801.1 hypothetical protein N7522_000509 [Penicillium canescens]KAJ6047137.1 hypothetical protein N7446_011971 [Penicillium canescens]KAJ6174439.1 hypothetical protein N7485_005505 [Penicillium canescens]